MFQVTNYVYVNNSGQCVCMYVCSFLCSWYRASRYVCSVYRRSNHSFCEKLFNILNFIDNVKVNSIFGDSIMYNLFRSFFDCLHIYW